MKFKHIFLHELPSKMLFWGGFHSLRSDTRGNAGII